MIIFKVFLLFILFKGFNFQDLMYDQFYMTGTILNLDFDTESCSFVGTESIPIEFDARLKWPHCSEIIGDIRNQVNCKSCWAVSTASTISDRICIATNGKQKVKISALDLMTCSSDGGRYDCDIGGYIQDAYNYWVHHGTVSGGNYGENETCRPYPIAPREKWKRYLLRNDTIDEENYVKKESSQKFKNCSRYNSLFYCEQKCVNNLDYEKDKHYGEKFCVVRGDSDKSEQIQRQIMKFGSVTAGFRIYEDFMKGFGDIIYEHESDGEISEYGHAVKIIGWGVKNSTKYWLIANSWGKDSPAGKDGYFKMIRGIDNCGIESSVYSGFPLI